MRGSILPLPLSAPVGQVKGHLGGDAVLPQKGAECLYPRHPAVFCDPVVIQVAPAENALHGAGIGVGKIVFDQNDDAFCPRQDGVRISAFQQVKAHPLGPSVLLLPFQQHLPVLLKRVGRGETGVGKPQFPCFSDDLCLL